MSACIVIDIGNTSTSIGFYENRQVTRVTDIRNGIADPVRADTALRKAGIGSVSRAVIASVVPGTVAQWRWLLEKVHGTKAVFINHETPMPVGLSYPEPQTIGADRLAAASGTMVRYGAPAIVADFGTALTFDVLNTEGCYAGGVIAPGLPLMTDYLHEKTALLPRVTLEGTPIEPVGTSTEAAMRIGALMGHRGMVREVVNYLRKSVGTSAHLCATGGYAQWALKDFDLTFNIDPDLTLFGLGTIHDMNS